MRIDVEWNQLESLKVKHPIIPFSTRISLHSESRIYVDWVLLHERKQFGWGFAFIVFLGVL